MLQHLQNFVQRLFPCSFNEPSCRTNRWGCRCGKKRGFFGRLFGGGSSKAAAHEADVARQTQEKEAIRQQFLSQLAPGSAEYNQLSATPIGTSSHQQVSDLGSQLVSQQQARIGGGGAATPFEQRTNLSVEQLRKVAGLTPEEQDVFGALRGQPTTTPIGQLLAQLVTRSTQPGGTLFGQISPEAAAYQTRLGQQGALTPEQQYAGVSPQASLLAQTIQQQLATPPSIPFEDTLAPELQLARQQVGAAAAQRGLTGSGLELENLGRSGVELAIRQAGLRQQNRALNEQLRQQSLSNASSLIAQQYGVGQDTANRIAALIASQEGLRSQAQTGGLTAYGLGENLRNRQIGVEGDVTNLQAGRESRLTDLLGRSGQTSITNLNDVLQGRVNTFQSLADAQLQRQLATQAALGQLAGTVGGAAIGSFIPGLGAILGSQIGGNLTGGTTNPGSPAWLLALQRSGQGTQPAFYAP